MAFALNVGRRALLALGLALLLTALAGGYWYAKHRSAAQSQNLTSGNGSESLEVFSLDAAFPTTVEDIWPGIATCLTPNQLDDQALLAALDDQSVLSPHISARIRGFDFDRQPQVLMDAFARLTRDMPGPASTRKPSCGTVACAADEVFGSGIGLRLLYLLVRYQFNASYFGSPGATPWTAAELDVVIAALHDFPPALLPFQPGLYRPLLRDGRVERFVGLASGPRTSLVAISAPDGKVGIRVGSLWEERYRPFRRVAIFHELAHDFMRSQQLLFDARSTWQNAICADTRLGTSEATPHRSVSRYATTSLDEDFAESATAYRYMPVLLKRRAPHRYRLLQFWMFDGLDYMDAATCADARSLSSRASNATMADMMAAHGTQPQFAAMMIECRRIAIGPRSPARSAEIRQCMIAKLFPDKFGGAIVRTAPLSRTSPVAGAIVASRTRNTQFDIEEATSLGPDKSLELTNQMRRTGCGGDCHMPPVPPASGVPMQSAAH